MTYQKFVLSVVLGATMFYSSGSEAQTNAQVNPLPKKGTATLVDRQGKTIGALTFEETPNGVLIRGELTNLPQGTHGFHIHDKGACTPNFEAAGGHFNPTGTPHGYESGGGPHLGDLPNLHVPANGRVYIETFATDVTLGEDNKSLVSGDGTAIMVHAGADDYRTDPTGASGDRIACGVIRRNP